jgi:hypothetical protein
MPFQPKKNSTQGIIANKTGDCQCLFQQSLNIAVHSPALVEQNHLPTSSDWRRWYSYIYIAVPPATGSVVERTVPAPVPAP